MDRSKPKNRLLIWVLLYCFLPPSIMAQSLVDDRASRDTGWDQLFIRKSGWFGGDGIFAIPLDGKEFIPASENTETLFVFGDTMIGEIKNGKVKRGDFAMINNSIGYLKGRNPDPNKISFHWNQDEAGNPNALFVPSTPNVEAGEYYWPGDGFVNIDGDGDTYLFFYRIRNIKGASVFPFEQLGVSLIRLPKGSRPPFTDVEQIETPLFVLHENNAESVTFGCGILANTKSTGAPKPDGYIYTYGIQGWDKELLVARVKPEHFIDFTQWSYWDGKQWSNDIEAAHPVAKNVSNEMSVSPLPDGRYVLTFHYGPMSDEVAIQIGRSPVGPFQPMKKIWKTPESHQDFDFFTYNSKAHPHLSPPGSLLMSYNVNSFDFFNDIMDKPHLDRPRFVLLQLD